MSNVYGEDTDTLRFVKRYIKATDCDLFFADGAIFVEGQAERILVPHFIRHHFGDLWRRYISLIDLGGSNAPRFKPLIKALGLTSLVITDLDTCLPTEVQTASGGTTTRNKKAKPKFGEKQVTVNPTLKTWHPCLTMIDDLLSVGESGHHISIEDEYDLYIAYQKAVADPTNKDGGEIIPRTFEDALVYANFSALKSISGSSTTNKIAELVKGELSGDELESALFEIVDNAEKAAFAIDCLISIEDGASLSPPPYIEAGLQWLQEKLDEPVLVVVDTGVIAV
jgi:predicted ATP-dependent endonuclease of OLD family